MGNVTILCLDWYYHDLSHLTLSDRMKHNFDHPASIEDALLAAHLEDLLGGHSVQAPQYDYGTHTRKSETLSLETTEWILAEGLFALHWPGIRDKAALKVFIDLEREVCLTRRLERDVKQRMRSTHFTQSQFEEVVWPMYEAHVHDTREFADLVLPGDGEVAEIVAILHNALVAD